MTTQNIDQWARELLEKAWQETMPQRAQTLAAMQALQAICRLESHYGKGWHGAMQNSSNWGAIQSTRPRNLDGTAPPGTALAVDTHPRSDGSDVPYTWPFKVYPNPYEGALDVVRWFAKNAAVLDAAETGNTAVFSSALYHAHYYEGYGPSQEARIEHHAQAVQRHAQSLADALGEACMFRLHQFGFVSPNLPDKSPAHEAQVARGGDPHDDEPA